VTIRKALFPLLLLFALLSSRITVGYALVFLIAVLWVASSWRLASFRAALTHPLTVLATAFAALVALSVAFSLDAGASARALRGLSLLLLVPITIDVVDGVGRARGLLLAVAASGTILALIGIFEAAQGGSDLHNRIRGPLSHYMTLSSLTLIAGCILLAFAFEGRGWTRALGGAAVVPFAAMLSTLTRGAYVAAVAAVAAYLAVRRPRGLLVLVPVLAAVYLLLPADLRGRAASIVDPTERTNRDRIAMARAGGRMIADHPISGLGPELVKPYYTLYRDPDAPRWRVPHLHNNVLQIAAESGVFTAAAYVAMVGLFLVRCAALLRVREGSDPRSLTAAAAFLAVVAATVAGFFEYNFGDKEVLMATLPLLALPFSRGMSEPGTPRIQS
jgi:putative inorganic carbon (hco3(-)) transporter